MLVILAILGLFLLPSPWNVVGVCVAAVVEVGEVIVWRKFLRRYRVRVGAEAMVGEHAEVIEALDPEGRVRLRGEIWNARSATPAGVGETVRVGAVDGLTLEVEPERG
jgi:membrane protein implicated in regulation of membrane protease activity